MSVCPFCKKELNCNAVHHVYKCKSIPVGLTKDEIKELYYKFNFGDTIYEDVIRDYQNLYSLPMLKEKYGLCYRSIIYILNKFSIPIRNMKTSQKLITAPKYKNTCLKKYGCENVSQLESVKHKKEQTFIKNYGVDNIWKTPEYAEFTSKRWASYSPKRKAELLKKWRNSKGNTSELENKIYRYLNEIGLSVITQFKFDNYYHAYDFLITGTNIIIEVNGDFWHANPMIYSENDVLNFPNNPVKAIDLWKKDNINNVYAKSNGYEVITLWEHDINNKSKEEIQIYLIDIINNLKLNDHGTEKITKHISED